MVKDQNNNKQVDIINRVEDKVKDEILKLRRLADKRRMHSYLNYFEDTNCW